MDRVPYLWASLAEKTESCNKKEESLHYQIPLVAFIMCSVYNKSKLKFPTLVGPCQHGMARPQAAGRGTASDKEGSCE